MGGRSFLVTEVTDDDPDQKTRPGGLSLPAKAALAALVTAFFLLNGCGAHHDAPAPAPATTATTHS
jgi:hypothetical protein